MKTTPLHDEHERLGASFTDFAGWSMPVRYTSELAEHRAVRETAGQFDLSHMGEVEFSGPESGQALDYAFVGNMSTIRVGRARYTVFCAADGGIIDDLVVYRLEDQRFLVVPNAGNAAVVAEELRTRAHGFDTEVIDRSPETALIALQGPRSATIISEVTDAELSELKYFAGIPASVGGTQILLARTGYTGEDGFELFVPADAAERIWKLLLEHGEPHGAVPAGLACRDTLRLEAGMHLYGNELSTTVTPFEANLGRLVKFEKSGDFVGRSALEKLAEQNQDGPERVLVGLQGSGRRAPRPGYRLLHEDTDVGEVTSGVLSPTLGYPIGMAYVSAELAEPGTALAVDIRGKQLPVEVVSIPFYRR